MNKKNEKNLKPLREYTHTHTRGTLNNRKIHNGIISFWKFMFALMIVIFHVTINYKGNENTLLKYGAIGVEFFFIVSGYFIAKKAFSVKEDCSNIGKETMSYILGKVKKFLPYTCSAFAMFIIVDSVLKGYSLKHYINSIWNVIFLDMSGVKTTYISGITWYISVMLISILIIYPLIRKYKKNFTYLIAPIIVIFIGGYLAQKYGNLRFTLDMDRFCV